MGNRLLRYGSAMVLLTYGFAKINGSQFTILDSELDKPMGQVSGFWLTWYYFGYSTVYGTILALVQIAGALLLTFRRTALLGACVLAPVLGNIVLIDVFYGVEPSATLVAIVLLTIMLSLIAARWQDLSALLLPESEERPETRSLAKWTVRLAMMAVAFVFTYWLANVNNRNPTPIDGAWDVVGYEPAQPNEQVPVRVFFEFNRAGMAVLKYADGTYRTHGFDVEASGSLRLRQQWLGESAEVFRGNYTLSGGDLRIEGTFAGMDRGVFHLQRRAVR